MRKLKRIIGSNGFFYITLTFVIILIGQLPFLLHILHTPKGSYHPYLDTLASSDYYYPALVRFGMGQDWLLKIPYVYQNHQGSLIQIFFVILGKIALLTGLGPAEVFALSRVVGGIVFITAVIYFLHQILPKDKTRVAFLIFLLAQPLPKTINFFKEDVGMWVWHFGEAARRVSALPSHYTVGKGLAVLALGFLFHAVKTRNVKAGFLSGLVAFVAGMIYPPPVFMILFSLGVTSLAWIVINKFSRILEVGRWIFLISNSRILEFLKIDLSRHQDFKTPALPAGRSITSRSNFKNIQPQKYLLCNLVYIAAFIIASLLPLIILRMELNKGFPWNMWQAVELGWNDPSMRFEVNYARQLGGILIFVPFAVVSVLKKKQFSFITVFTLIWAFSAFLLFPIANVLSLGKFRFTEGLQILPLAILGYEGFLVLLEKIKKVYSDRIKKIIRYALIFLFMANFLLGTILMIYHSTVKLWGYWTNIYFNPAQVAAMRFIDVTIPKDSVVVTDAIVSTYLPVFARVKTILGFSDFYKEYPLFLKDRDTVNSILEGKLPQIDAQEFFMTSRASFLYRQTAGLGNTPDLYPQLLKRIFSNDAAQVYKVRDLK